MPYDKIDAARIEVFPLSQRRNLLDIEKLALFDALDVVFGGDQHDYLSNHKLYFLFAFLLRCLR